MTTPGQYRDHADPVHIWAVCSAAAQAAGQHGTALLASRRFPVRIVMPGRPAARTAVTALRAVGYEVDRLAAAGRGRELIVHRWSAERLEARLTAMRSVIERLTADPGATAAALLDRLAQAPAAPPGSESHLELARLVARELDAWVAGACGQLVTVDPRAWPSDRYCALRLGAVEDASEAVIDLSVRHLQITEHALATYSELRATASHADAREIALRQARIAFPLSSPPAHAARPHPGQDGGPEPDPGTPAVA